VKLSANKQLLVVAVVCLAVIVSIKVWLNYTPASTDSVDFADSNNTVMRININDCDVSKACEVPVDNYMVKVSIAQPIVLLKPFTVAVTVIPDDENVSLSNALLKPVVASFTMQNMNMGMNHFKFNSNVNDRWQAEVLLPICSQKRMDWLMEISMEAENNKVYRLTFPVTASPR